MEQWIDDYGLVMMVHDYIIDCTADGCPIHAPSSHSMRQFKRLWRADRALMERICPHNVGHPDPDDIAYKKKTRGAVYAHNEAVHGCDGCCNERL